MFACPLGLDALLALYVLFEDALNPMFKPPNKLFMSDLYLCFKLSRKRRKYVGYISSCFNVTTCYLEWYIETMPSTHWNISVVNSLTFHFFYNVFFQFNAKSF